MSQVGDVSGPTPATGLPSALDAESAASGLFARKSSGLVREISLSGAFGINLGVMSIGAAFAYFVLLMTTFPLQNGFWTLLIGGILIMCLVWVYGQLATTMPRSGGDYLYAGRIFHPAVGAWVGFALLGLLWWSLDSAAPYLVDSFIPPVFADLGSWLHISFFTTLSGDIATKSGTVITCVVILIATFALLASGVRIATSSAYWFTIAALIGALGIIAELFFHGNSTFIHQFNGASGSSHAYQSVIAQARAHGWTPGYTTSATINAIPFTFLAYGSFWFSAYAGGEVKRPARTQFLAQILAISIGVAVVVLGWVAITSLSSTHFMQASAYLQANDPTAWAKITTVATTPQGYATIVTGGAFVNFALALLFAVGIFPVFVAFVLSMSRTLFAFSFDRLLPEWVADVRGRHHAPLAAMVVSFVVVAPLFYLVVYSTGFTAAFHNVISIGAGLALVASIGVVALPYRRKQLYRASPEIAPGTWFGVPRVVFIGTFSIVYCAVILYLTLFHKQWNGGFTTSSIIVLLVMATGGIFIYGIVYAIRRRQGVDLSLVMRELPPD